MGTGRGEGAGAGFSLVSNGTGAEESQGCGLASLTRDATSSSVTQQVGRLVEGMSWAHKEKGSLEVGSGPGVGTGVYAQVRQG